MLSLLIYGLYALSLLVIVGAIIWDHVAWSRFMSKTAEEDKK